MVDVVRWVEGNANDLSKRFGGFIEDAPQQTGEVIGDAQRRAGDVLNGLEVLAGTLEPDARNALAGLQLSASQVADLARSGLSLARSAAAIARGTVGSAELLVTIGATYSSLLDAVYCGAKFARPIDHQPLSSLLLFKMHPLVAKVAILDFQYVADPLPCQVAEIHDAREPRWAALVDGCVLFGRDQPLARLMNESLHANARVSFDASAI